MALPVKAHHLKRYKDVAQLLFKYGQFDIVKSAGLAEILREEEGSPATKTAQSSPSGADNRNPKAFVAPKEEELTADLEKLGPAFVRLGQLLAGRPDLIPLPYLPPLAHLKENARPMDIGEVEKLIAAELGVNPNQAFKLIEPLPLVITSLDQAHRAILKNGKTVVVKIQRPGVSEQIYDDLAALDEMVQVYEQARAKEGFDFRTMLEELRTMLISELDYRQEAHNLRTLKELLKDLEGIIVPDPIRQYSTARMLTTTATPGSRLDSIKTSGLLRTERLKLAEQVFSAYVQQIFVDGFVHSNPRQDNLHLTADGRIEFFDLGPIVRITPSMRGKLVQLILSINEGRAEQTVEALINLNSVKPASIDEPGFARAVNDLVLANRDKSADRLEIGKILQGISQAALRFRLRLPYELAVVGSVLLNVDEIIHVLEPQFDTHTFIKKQVAPVLHRHVRGSLTSGHIYHTLFDTIDLFEKLPGKVNRILDSIAKNEFKVTVHAIDEAILISGFQKIANRITVGLILAALILGAALLMRVQTPFMIWGYPGLAIICFMLAATCAFGLVVEILVSDHRSRS